MYLGIDQQSGLVYEGLDGPVLPVVPRPTVTQAKLIKREGIGTTDLAGPYTAPAARPRACKVARVAFA
ncbi:hypothetical protein NLM33_36865 [Bradyrhizobium sp. CCGUVB1N3]|uniref:hypothetical protein n=1 Tax=Bradyrhizobium sp. CCGUVB1N3 TaxID=2949629 RepID=UPI0020B23A89|nr:hypothetical protein [Bradyrhizobium sp. CCGUVB1N3]MCP3475822.1 hypothetical protein [Bradyrhizobium sp. CCGUVB1N3]